MLMIYFHHVRQSSLKMFSKWMLAFASKILMVSLGKSKVMVSKGHCERWLARM